MSETEERKEMEEMKEIGNGQSQGPEKKEPGMVKKVLQWIVFYVETFILILVGQVVGGILIYLISSVMKAAGMGFVESDTWVTGSMYLNFIGIWIVALLYLRFSRKERHILKMLWTGMSGNNVKGFLIGALIGGGANAFCVLIAWLHHDIALYFDAFRPLSLLFLLIAVLIQSAAEELTCRAYLYRKLMDFYKENFWLSAILSSLLFALLHTGNSGVTILSLLNIFLSGVMFVLMVYYMDSLWAAFAGHMAWNYTQNIIFGLPNSGNVMPYSILKLDVASATNSFAYNVGFGIEGTLVADIVLFACCVGLYLWGENAKKKA